MGYIALRNAIFAKAVEDFRAAYRNNNVDQETMDEVESFLRSKYADILLCGKVSGSYVYKLLKKEKEEYEKASKLRPVRVVQKPLIGTKPLAG